MITFFTHCRPFVGEFDGIQTAAISSWTTVADDVQVILVGDDGVDAAKRLNVDHKPLSGYNEFGTPLVNALFAVGHDYARHDIMCEISSDIILSADCALAFETMLKYDDRPFMVGARIDVDKDADGEPRYAKHQGCAIDYFAYARGTLGDIPPFAIGRDIYDQWLLWAARHKWDMMTIDATDDIFALHINHARTPRDDSFAAERLENDRLAIESGCRTRMNIEHAEYVMSAHKVAKR
jgi:hypothetical protein